MRVPAELSWGLLLASAIVLAGVQTGCKAAPSSSPDTTAPEAEQGGEAADPLARLAQLESQMRAYGLEPGTAGTTTTAGGDADDGAEQGDAEASDVAMGAVSEDAGAAPAEPEPEADTAAVAPPASEAKAEGRETQQRCEDLCSLNVAICELEASICALAEDHGDDPTYADACERASEDCEISAEACDRCDA